MMALLNRYQKISIHICNVSLMLIIIGLFFSRALISIGFFVFLIGWLIEGDFKNKWISFKKNAGALRNNTHSFYTLCWNVQYIRYTLWPI